MSSGIFLLPEVGSITIQWLDNSSFVFCHFVLVYIVEVIQIHLVLNFLFVFSRYIMKEKSFRY